ncbi:ABC transporter permease [Aeromicrobium sp. UC242_57]|uniref:ABC transporter permease n=1 Tax=Aeromicrobium sp. UC242_57 TaxID=3374624 RepID=UPI003796C04E
MTDLRGPGGSDMVQGTDEVGSTTGHKKLERGVNEVTRVAVAKYGLLAMLAIEIVVFLILAPDTFGTTANVSNILASQAILMIVTLGLTIPVLAGEFDVSVAHNLGFSMVLVGYLTVLHGWPLLPALVACVLAGALIGLINAVLVVKVGINSFIATIGVGTVLAGLTVQLSGTNVIPGLPEPLVKASSAEFLGLPLPVFYGLGLALILWVVYEWTPVGRRIMFVGAGREAARLAGVNVVRIRGGAFVASGVIASLAGLTLAGQFGASDPLIGSSYLLPAFAGAFLGATTIKPGRPNAWGTVIALYVLTVGVTGLQLLGAGPWVQDVFNGGALIVGVTIARLAARRDGQGAAL